MRKQPHLFTKNKIIKYRLPALLLAVVILLLCAYMVYWVTQKEGYYVDDMFSMMSIRGGDLSRPYYSDRFFNTWHNASELESTIGVSPDNAFTGIELSRGLYWSLMHIAYSLTPGEFTIWPSLILNLIFFIAALIVVYKLSLIFIKNEYLALLPVIAWGISSAAVNMVMLIRFYSFKVFICTLLVYVVYKAIINGFKWQHMTVVLLLVALGTTTHQYFFVFAFFLTAFVCIYLLLNKQYKPLLIFAGIMAAGIIVYQLVTGDNLLRVFTDFEEDSFAQQIRQLIQGTEDFPERIAGYSEYLSSLTFAGIGMNTIITLSAAMAAIICAARISSWREAKELLKRKETAMWLIAGGICVCYVLVVARITPGVPSTQRYMFCITPLLTVLFISLLVKTLNTIGFQRVAVIFTVIAVSCTVLLTVRFDDVHVYREDKAVNEMLESYHHLPVVCLNYSRERMSHYYWQLFEFENEVFFTLTEELDYEAIKEKVTDDGLILIVEAIEGNPLVETGAFAEDIGLGYSKLLTVLPNRYWEFRYYLVY